MKSNASLWVVLIAAFSTIGCAQMRREFAPNIRGNYVLDYRELPDGRTVKAPEVGGVMSITRDMRNFNVFWTENGKQVAISSISRYHFDGDQYTEECLFYAAPATMPAGAMTGSSPFTKRDEQVLFQFPLHGEPAVTFTHTGLTAMRQGAFIDHWKKVE